MPRKNQPSSISSPSARAAQVAQPETGRQIPASRQLNAWDSVFLYMDTPDTPMYGGFLHIYAPLAKESPAQRYQRLRWHIQHSLDASPVFRRMIAHSPLDLDHAWFVEGAEVDLEYHVRHHALPDPGGDAELNELYARIAVQPMDRNRPLWEIHVIDGLDAVEGVPRGGFAMFIKFHHAAVDGRSAAEITSVLHRTTPERNKITRLQPHRVPIAPPAQTVGNALLSTVDRYAQLSAMVGRKLVEQLPSLGRTLSKRLLGNPPSGKKPGRDTMSVPQTIFNIEISADRCYTHLSLSLDDIKRIRQQVAGSTVNDVYLAVVGGALRAYLRQHDALPKKSLVVGVTVDIRSDEQRGKGGNHLALIRVPLRTDEANALRRLTGISADTAKAKASLQKSSSEPKTRKPASLATMIPAPLLWLLGSANRLRITARLKPLVNLGATNVPGPREVLYLDGARMVDFNGAPPFFHGVAMVVNTTSYDNALRVSVTACRSVMPDPEYMRQCLRASFAELKQTNARTSARPAAKKTTASKPGRTAASQKATPGTTAATVRRRAVATKKAPGKRAR